MARRKTHREKPTTQTHEACEGYVVGRRQARGQGEICKKNKAFFLPKLLVVHATLLLHPSPTLDLYCEIIVSEDLPVI